MSKKMFAVISVDAGEDDPHEAGCEVVGVYLTKKEATAAKKAAVKDFKAEQEEDFGEDVAYMYDKDTVLMCDGQYGQRFLIKEIEIPA